MTSLPLSARTASAAASASTACAVVPVFDKGSLTPAAEQLDKLTSGSISNALKLGDFSAKPGQTLLLPGTAKVRRILLVGCGNAKQFNRATARQFVDSLSGAVNRTLAKDAIVHAADLSVSDGDSRWLLDCIGKGITASQYHYTRTLSKPKDGPNLKKVMVSHSSDINTKTAQKALEKGGATGSGMNTARELANLPGNICTPLYLADQARQLAKATPKLSTKILDEKQMKELGMGSLLSVSAGSDEPARLIVMTYKGGKAGQKPYVLVGKGVTFDSGGISLKPGAKMDEMKYDMGGAASVFGTMEAVCQMGIPLNIIAIVGAVENMPSGGATKPGDVVTSMSGKTIEVLNTDAEGRMVLCDCLTYVERFNPPAVIDIATLTGACVVALGAHATAVYANKQELADQLLTAGVTSHDRAWQMPLWDDYQKQLSTNFADMANIGGPGGGSITAACFLARFTESYTWAHLDVAGTAWNSAPKGATGRPVALLTQYLADRAGI
jgi:leucyl aminopeptidase